MTYDTPRQFVRVEKSIDFEYTVEGSPFKARVTDLSEGGAFVDATYPQGVGARLAFRFRLPDGSEPIAGNAEVIWAQEMLGMGIRFLDLTEEQTERLRFFVGSVYFDFGLDELPDP
ncbi:MAG: PilZ domain-containing protein [Thermoanaerobaculia bacterium]|nr:PilZ domain-containing protein [Thermoanaerobaculia bacterium]